MSEVILRGHPIIGGNVEGRAMVSNEPICWLLSVDLNGLVVEKGHSLEGKNIAGTILVFPTGKGSTAGSYKLYEMGLRGSAPKAIINVQADTVTISGAVLGNIPMIHRLEPDPIQAIREGDEVIVDGDKGVVRVIQR